MDNPWHGSGEAGAADEPDRPAIFFDGVSSRRRAAAIGFGDELEISESAAATARWTYADIRRADSPAGMLRLACISAPPLARLEIRDEKLARDIVARCPRLDEHRTSGW